ncbi:MAG: hypothetical protein Alpg2KO_07270 [Alphaproteobacteria bacterium]
MSQHLPEQDIKDLRRFLRTQSRGVLDQLTQHETCFSSAELQLALADLPTDALPPHLHRIAAARMIRNPRLVTRLGDGSMTATWLYKREKALDKTARKLAAQSAPLVTPGAFRKAVIALDEHYKAEEQDPDPAYEAALKHLMSPGSLKLLAGPPGAHKSKMMHLLVEARRASDPNRKSRVLVTADSDRVTSSLAEEVKAAGAILDTVLAEFKAGRSPLEKGGLLVVDEAAMLGTRRMANLLEGADAHGLNVILIGDSQQMPPRTAGQPFRYLETIAPTAQLAQTWRQRQEDERQATLNLRDGDAASAVAVYADKGRVRFAEKRKETLRATVDAYVERRINKLHSPRSMLMVGMTAKDATRMNKWVRKELIAANVIGASQQVGITGGETLDLSMGDRVLIDENITPEGHDRPVYAGSAGFVTRITGKWIDIMIDGKSPRAMRLSRAEELPLSHGYAIDLRRAQGLKADHTYIAVTQEMGPGAGLVAFSRHKRSARFFVNKKTFQSLPQFARALTGNPHKTMALDLPAPKAGIAPDTPKADRRGEIRMFGL